MPVFDWILLGIGENGHTTSIFPDSPNLEDESSLCAVATYPPSCQKRITLNLPVLNNANRISFLVSDKAKAQIVAVIFLHQPEYRSLLTAGVQPRHGELAW